MRSTNLAFTTCLLSPLVYAAPTPSSILGGLSGSGSESSPNPIASQYPSSTTGTINGTVAVVPISYELARSIVPSKYGILKNAYESSLTGFPADSYPLIIRSILDHDVGQGGLNIVPDFQSIHIFYPFVDLLGDGYSSFVYEKYLLVTDTNLIAQAGVSLYGETPVLSSFSPSGEAYGYVASSEATKPGEIYLNAYTHLLSNTPAVTTSFAPISSIGPWPLEFYVNVTNQPVFSDGLTCDQQITLYNTTLSEGKNAPVGVQGNISVVAPYLPSESSFTNVYGVKVDIAFIENNLVSCSSLKGYSGTGSGD